MVGKEKTIRCFVSLLCALSFNMIVTGFLLAVMLSHCRAAAESSDEIPFLVAAQGPSGDAKVSNLLPEIDEPDVPTLTSAQSPTNRGRSDIEIEEEQPPRGYFYPKPEKPFNLPEFMTLDANVPLQGVSYFAEEDSTEVERLPRSPRRRPPPPFVPGFIPPNNARPPPFVPGFIPPNHIRPLPALYGRPARY